MSRLRLAFFTIGLVLLLPLAWLLRSVEQRLEGQRRLRHEVVAERIFDELERELTEVLERESARTSSVYDVDTQPAAWAPFVVGYFKDQGGQLQLLASAQLESERRQRISWAVERWRASRADPARRSPLAGSPAEGEKAQSGLKGSSFDVLRQLNRADEQRLKPHKRDSSDSMGVE